MNPVIEISIDHERQILIARTAGDFDEPAARELNRRITEVRAGLRNPSVVRILQDARELGKADLRARKEMITGIPAGVDVRVAIWGASLVVRTIANFLCIARGVDFIRSFPDEQRALSWLLRDEQQGAGKLP